MTPTYVYGIIAADAELPAGLKGLGPTGKVSLVTSGEIAAVVGDVPVDRPLGTREDLLGHEAVVDSVAGTTTILPMRFPAVVEEDGVLLNLRFAAVGAGGSVSPLIFERIMLNEGDPAATTTDGRVELYGQ